MALAIALAYGVLPTLRASAVAGPPRTGRDAQPADVGWAAEDVAFPTGRGESIRGWYAGAAGVVNGGSVAGSESHVSLWRVADARHVEALDVAREAYMNRAVALFDGALGVPAGAEGR